MAQCRNICLPLDLAEYFGGLRVRVLLRFLIARYPFKNYRHGKSGLRVCICGAIIREFCPSGFVCPV